MNGQRTRVLIFLVLASACEPAPIEGEERQEVRVDGNDFEIPSPFIGHWVSNRRIELPLGMWGQLPGGDILDPQLAEIGNLLYFDRRLSKGAVMACATCHEPAAGYSTTDFVRGVDGNLLPRTASVGLNRMFGEEHGWAGERTLEEQSSMPITSADEMGLTKAQLLAVVSSIPGYVDRLQRLTNAGVLSAPAVSVKNVERALATFQRVSLMTGNSPVDRFEAGDAEALTAAQRRGRRLFHHQARCVLCHKGPNYTDEKFHFIVPGSFSDRGRQDVTGRASDFGKFKTPSLRNAALRNPYFHNGDPLPSAGLALTLEDVVRRYNGGASPGGSALVIRLGLTLAQQGDVAEFIRGLTGEIPLDPWLSKVGRAQSGTLRENIYLSPAIFDEAYYRARYSDLRNLSTSQLRHHWLGAGIDEGRIGSSRFAVREYIQLYPLVFDAYNGTSDKYRRAINNYLNHGRRIGRVGRYPLAREFFRVNDYRKLNGSDIALLSEKDAIDHYLDIGFSEGLPARRDPTGYFIIIDSGVRSYFYADGTAYCRFSGMEAQRENRGTQNDTGVARLRHPPSNLKNGGACVDRFSPPRMLRPAESPEGAVVEFSCRRIGSSETCLKKATCPSGMKVRAVRAGCNLEGGAVEASRIDSLQWNRLNVFRRSTVLEEGHCRIDAMYIKFGHVKLLPNLNRRDITVGCRENESNGGECHIRGQLLCSP